VRSLPSGAFDCHIVVPAPPPLAAEYAAAGATVHVVPMRRISTSHGGSQWLAYALAWPFAVLRLARLVRRHRTDIVHTNSLHSWYGWAAAALTHRPHVWHAREIVVQSGAALRVERFLARRFARVVICMSKAIAAQLDPRNTVIVHESVDEDEFRPSLAGAFRDRTGIGDGVALVGSAGRIDTWKGVDTLLDAWPTVRAARPDAELVVAGGPVTGKEKYFDALAARAAELAGVHWLGHRDDVPELLADLDAFALPSSEPEPYGLIAIEALASGSPVVVTDGGGATEIVARAGADNGRVVARGDAAALAAALVDLLPPSTSAATRRRRTSRQPPGEMDRFAALFEQVTGPNRRSSNGKQ